MRRKSKKANSKKETKDALEGMKFDQWAAECMPQWMKDAKAAIENNQIDNANTILDEKFVNDYLWNTSGTNKIFSMYHIAGLLKNANQLFRAEQMYEDLLKINNHSAVFNELADIFRKTGRIGKAVIYLKRAIDVNPNQPLLSGNLATNLINLGQVETAIEIDRKLVEKRPDDNFAFSNMLLHMHYLPKLERSVMYDAAVKWAKRNMPQRLAKTNHINVPDPDKKLKIGYISPDFRNHSVNYFFEPLLEAHNREKVEVYGYGNVCNYDETTERLKNKFDQYRNVRPLDDKQTAEIIENDEIDILVDLAGHSGDSKIYAMAYKPAPIQVTWCGYPDTTGMSQIDYRITDAITDPPGSEKYYSEKLMYIPDTFLCYGPGSLQPPIAPSPVLANRYITFGCFNNSSKINTFIIGLWAKILNQVPNSNLLLKFKSGQDDEIREIFLKKFEDAGVTRDRIAISGWLQSPADLTLYNRVDIALDTYPYNGTTTTCQSLLMGVPVVSLIGEHHMSRVGLSILTNLGFEFFAAPTPEQYVARAVALALKPDSLAKIRNTMRDRMRTSSLCNQIIFAKRMEDAYRNMWHTWCQKQNDNKLVESSPQRL
ncbi:MAG: hypothetical protein A2Y10_04650 [Planctomycetes bacterium GWF2_41_51]|nr:MAG: hypothetical protein A2Y10_04650 [Planctomycetes bacterium GWF2_41_51]HBG26635.1 glycosyltransferase [Phycisphaerales bacterium]